MERENSAEINIIELFVFIRRRFWILILAAIVFAGATYGVCKYFMTPQYVASTRIYTLKQGSDNNQLVYSDLQVSTQLAKDYETLIVGRNVTSIVIKNLDLNMSNSQLAGKITVTMPGSGERTLQINVRDADPQLAAQIANEVCEVAREQLVSIMGMEAVNLVYEAEVPASPSSPATTRNSVIAGIIGAIAAFIVLLIYFVMDDRIKTEEDVERYLKLNTVGTIPYCEEFETARTENGSKSANKHTIIKKSSKKSSEGSN